MTQASLCFDGPGLTREDRQRLTRQLDHVRELMLDGRWRTHRDISALVGSSETGAAARLRDLKKKKFGGYLVEKRRVVGTLGLYEYRVLVAMGGAA